MNICKIIRLYSNIKEKNIENLKRKYENIEDLRKYIYELTDGYLNVKDNINNKTIFIKPNWVKENESEDDDICLRTNNNIIIALIENLIEYKPRKIIIGDAPIQRCKWPELLNKEFLDYIDKLKRINNIAIEIKDLRKKYFDPKNNEINIRNTENKYVIFDLKNNSYLEEVSSVYPNFRVTDYNYKFLADSHISGTHKYCISKEFLESDLIISVPKIKTHQKTGFTAALKNLVGINVDKSYLPHHRVGGTQQGGDCYPGRNIFRKVSEKYLDKANLNQGRWSYRFYYKLALIMWKISIPNKYHQISAGWWGNDTTWRMVMDINKIALYGDKEGKIRDNKQRTIFSLCDGIIAGEGNGPLNPTALALGIIIFSNNNYLCDIVLSRIMNLEYLPIIKEANKEISNQNNKIIFNNKNIEINDLDSEKEIFKLPDGWLNINNLIK